MTPNTAETTADPREAKRKIILQTALAVFADRGFDGITIEAVADVLGYTKPALYYYFKNKNDLLAALVLEHLREAHGTILSITERPASPRERLQELLRFYLDKSCQQRGFFTLDHHLKGYLKQLEDASQSREIFELSAAIPRMIIAMISEGVEQGQFRREDPAVLGSLLFSLLAGVVTHLEMPALSTMGVEKLKDTVCEFTMKGIEP
jgi:AcrR family transcriptional regulator